MDLSLFVSTFSLYVQGMVVTIWLLIKTNVCLLQSVSSFNSVYFTMLNDVY